ncbi:paralemmin-1 isoform X4 [Ictalurus punctatus]|uniref:Paralemmin-1 isoform X4 n=1 Tax=Ictalurus punctatus TaxID=7998 RepID=A0A979EL53_ICTPU|nr:paralemmin-1 isoform X4 [Ictalurus punctatus]
MKSETNKDLNVSGLEMDEAEKYQQRLQAIAEKRQLQEEEEKVRREMEEEWLKLAHHKRKSLREQWLMEVTPSSAADPKLQSVIPTPQTTEQSAEETQSSERQMKKDVEKTKNINEESTQIGKNELSIHSADKIEKPAQTYLGEEDGNGTEGEKRERDRQVRKTCMNTLY